MAGRLAEHLRSGQASGFDPSLIVYNRTASVAEAFASSTGAIAVEAVADLATASVVFSMLPNDAVADAVTHCCCRRCRYWRCWLPSLCWEAWALAPTATPPSSHTRAGAWRLPCGSVFQARPQPASSICQLRHDTAGYCDAAGGGCGGGGRTVCQLPGVWEARRCSRWNARRSARWAPCWPGAPGPPAASVCQARHLE
jgi:hypothetical protein